MPALRATDLMELSEQREENEEEPEVRIGVKACVAQGALKMGSFTFFG